jgi:K+-sensing histidine kinase KdpD
LKRKRYGYVWGYLIALGIVIVVTGLGELIKGLPIFEPTNMDMLYILGVTISAFYLGFGPKIRG